MDCSGLWNCVQGAAWFWVDWKQDIKRAVGFRADSLHVLWGVLIVFGFAAILRMSLARFLPWFLLLVLACINEAADIWLNAKVDYADGAKDMLLTMLLPTLLLVTTRKFPRLYEPN